MLNLDNHQKQPTETSAQPIPRQKLFVDLIPQTAWFSNLRSELSAAEWKQVQNKTFHAAQMKCECCGGIGKKHPVECHERFSYDITTNTQTLIKTLALCPTCHKTTHFGMAKILGLDGMAIGQLQRVNKWGREQTEQHISQAFKEWRERNAIEWKLDARWLSSFISLSEKTNAKINNIYNGTEKRTACSHPVAGL